MRTERPSAPAQRRRYVFVVVRALAVALVVMAAVVASGLVQWGNSTCNGTASEIAHNRHDLRQSLLLLWAGAAVAPSLLAVLAARRGRRTWPWLCIAGACLALAGYQGLTAEPGTWCAF